MPHFDVFIIGGGPAGQRLARRCQAGGLSVGITEYRGFGGTCGLRGCDPKRVMVSVSEATDSVGRLVGHGVAEETSLDWQAMTGFVAEFVDPKPAAALASLREAGIAAYTGKAKFTGRTSLHVEGHTREDGSPLDPVEVSAERIVVATGQRPRPLDVPGVEYAKTSDDFHKLPELPKRILFVGGGYIALESAHIARRCGADITIVNNDDDPLAIFDADLADRLVELTSELGIDFVMNAKATAIERLADGSFRVATEAKDGSTEHYEVDLVLNTSGRVPNFAGLDLAAAGIEPTEAGIPVDDYYRSEDNDRVYAIGDCADGNGPPLTPVANLDGEALAETFVAGTPTSADYTGMPTAVYTLPELAMVGLTEQAARERGIDLAVTAELDHSGAFNARRVNARAYGYKTLVDRSTGKLVGAHLIGPRASEMINLFALAIRGGLDASVLGEVPWAYPTWGGDVSGMVPEG